MDNSFFTSLVQHYNPNNMAGIALAIYIEELVEETGKWTLMKYVTAKNKQFKPWDQHTNRITSFRDAYLIPEADVKPIENLDCHVFVMDRDPLLVYRLGYPPNDNEEYVLTIRQLSELRGLPTDLSPQLEAYTNYYSEHSYTYSFVNVDDIDGHLFCGIKCDMFLDLLHDLKSTVGEFRLILMFF